MGTAFRQLNGNHANAFILNLHAGAIQSQRPLVDCLTTAATSDASGLEGAHGALAIRTHIERPIVISDCSQSVAIEFADELSSNYKTLPGVLGPKLPATAFAERWSKLRGQSLSEKMIVRLYIAKCVRSL